MKRGFILIFIGLLFLFIVSAQSNKEEFRVRIDTKLLGNEGIIVNLTEFLGKQIDYYLLSKPDYVKVVIQSDFGLAKITPAEGKRGSEILIFTINKSKELSLNKTIKEDKIEEEFSFSLDRELNLTLDEVLDKALIDSVKNLDLKRRYIDFTEINFSQDIVFINIGNVTNINLKFEKRENEALLKNIDLVFLSEEEDNKYLFYEKKKINYFYFFKTNFIPLLIGAFSVILILLIILLAIKKKSKAISIEDFKKNYLNKLSILKRRCYKEDLDNIFDEFSKDMRSFLSKLLGIKYQFTYDELINELIIKKVDESIKKDLIQFAKTMLEKRYKKEPNVRELRELIDKGISIIQRF